MLFGDLRAAIQVFRPSSSWRGGTGEGSAKIAVLDRREWTGQRVAALEAAPVGHYTRLMADGYIERTLLRGDVKISEESLLAGQQIVIVLAEPGAGKSELLRSLASKLGVAVQRASLCRHRGLAEGAQPLVIDALDEVAKVDQSAIDHVVEMASKTGARHVVLASRSSEWDEQRSYFVGECFNREPTIVRLEPFTTSEQQYIFEHHAPNECYADFRVQASRFELDPILGNPQFLKLFADAYIRRGRRFTEKRQIFSDAIEKLASEATSSPWQRGRPPTSAIVTLAEEIFAKVLLAGSSGVSLLDLGDVDWPYIYALSAGDRTPVQYAVNTKLFKIADDLNNHEPVHRIVAEYCAASYLARRAGDPEDALSLSRMLSVIAPNDTTRDELRGLVGWMAALGNSVVQEACIRIDPYAVLANGDASQLSPSSKHLLLESLAKLSEVDPYFRRSDRWRRFSVAGLFGGDSVEQLRALLTGKDTSAELRDLLLELLDGSDAARLLKDTLLQLALDQGLDIFARIRAQRILMGLDDVDRRSIVVGLTALGDSGSLRIAVESADILGVEATGVDNVLDLLRRIGVKRNRSSSPRFSDARFDLRYHTGQLIQKLDVQSTAWLLDAWTGGLHCTCGKPKVHQCKCLPGPSKVIGLLIDRYFDIASPPHNPERVWNWIKKLIFNRQPPKDSAAVLALQGDDDLRRRIYEIAFASLTDIDALWDVRSTLSTHAGLRMKLSDYFAMADHAVSVNNVALWSHFYASHDLYRRVPGPDLLRAHLRRQAREDAGLSGLWSRYERGALDARRRQKEGPFRTNRRWKTREKRQAAERANYYHLNRDRIEAGKDRTALFEIANYYLANPGELSEFLEHPGVADRALLNCLPIMSPQTPTLHHLAEKDRPLTGILHAAVLVTFRATGHLRSIDLGVLRAVKTRVGGYAGYAPGESELLEREIDALIFPTVSEVRAFAEDFLEPQLMRPLDSHTDVNWLRFKEAFKPLQAVLALDWLTRYPDMPHSARDTLFDICAAQGDHSSLIALISSRCTDELARQSQQPGELASRDVFWTLRAFFFSPEPPPAAWVCLRQDPRMIFFLERRAGKFSRGESVPWPRLTARKVFDVLNEYVDAWPKVPLPSSFGSDSPPGETAYRFLRDVVFAIHNDKPESALPVLEAILSDERLRDFHSDAKSMRVAALREKTFESFVLPTPVAVCGLLDNNRVATVDDLRKTLLEELRSYQIWVRNAETDPLDAFYSDGRRLSENVCRNRIVDQLQPRLEKLGLSLVLEHQLADAKRCDFTVDAVIDGHRRLLVVEVKGQWHDALFHAASEQLHARYSHHPAAAMQGVYLVLWFGGEERVAGKRMPTLSTHEQLRDMICRQLPSDLLGLIDVFVLDLSPRTPSGSGALRTPSDRVILD
jgi:hypothetical protein